METMPKEQAEMYLDDYFLERNGFSPEMRAVSEVIPAGGGHMAYQRFILRFNGQYPALFVKAHDTTLFTDAERAQHSQDYLLKEATIYEYLRENKYNYIPNYAGMLPEGHLIMEELSGEEDDWQWRAPQDPESIKQYVEDTLLALNSLQNVPLPPPNQYGSEHFFPKRIMKVYMEEGWEYMQSPAVRSEVQMRIREWRDRFHEGFRGSADDLHDSLGVLTSLGNQLYDTPQQMYFSHHDARQANIGWHPNRGTRLVDWSWADVGFRNADTTMFIIDMTKSGYTFSQRELEAYFNPDHALLLLGHWLGRSIEPTREADTTVRFHQLASAVAAFKLLSQNNQIP